MAHLKKLLPTMICDGESVFHEPYFALVECFSIESAADWLFLTPSHPLQWPIL